MTRIKMINQCIFIPAYVKIHTVTSLADIHKIAIDLQEYPKYIWIYFILSQHSRDVIKHFIAWGQNMQAAGQLYYRVVRASSAL